MKLAKSFTAIATPLFVSLFLVGALSTNVKASPPGILTNTYIPFGAPADPIRIFNNDTGEDVLFYGVIHVIVHLAPNHTFVKAFINTQSAIGAVTGNIYDLAIPVELAPV